MGQLKAAPYPNFYTNLIWLSWVMSLCALAPPEKRPPAKWRRFLYFWKFCKNGLKGLPYHVIAMFQSDANFTKVRGYSFDKT